MMMDQVGDHVAHRRRAEIQARDLIACVRGADVGLLAGVELGIDEESVLQIVDADRRRLAESDRAQVAGDLDAALMCRLHSGREFGARDVHVGLERSRALIGPEPDHTGGLIGTAQLVHLRGERALAFQVRAGDVQARTGHAAGIDQALDIEVGIGLHAARGARGRDSAGQIEPREGVAHLGVERHSPAARIEQVLMHADNAGNHGVAGEVEHARAGGRSSRGGDPAVVDHQRLIFPRRGAGAVDDPHVSEGDHRRIEREKRRVAGLEASLRESNGRENDEDPRGFHQGD